MISVQTASDALYVGSIFALYFFLLLQKLENKWYLLCDDYFLQVLPIFGCLD